MESNKVAQETLEGNKKKMSGFPVQDGEEEEAAASPGAIILAQPLLLLRHVAHGCVGYLGSLASRLKPAAAACQPRQEEEGKIKAAAVVIEEEEVVVVQVQSRGVMPPQQPRGMAEGKVGSGGGYHH